MSIRIIRAVGLPLLLAVAPLASASAQQGPEPSTACRLFPLACPGPTPPMPPPLLGLPDEQGDASPPVQPPTKAKRHVRKHAKAH